MGQSYLKCHFLERIHSTSKGHIFKIEHLKKTYFFKESIIYPFVQLSETKKGLFLSNNEYVDILMYIQNTT